MSQKKRLLSHLKSGKKITRLEAWDKLGILECPARVCELRGDGHKVYTTMKQVINRYGEKVSIAEWRM